MGCSECAQRPPAPQKALGRLWGCTHTHTKGGVGKAKCHLSTTPEGAPGGLCWEGWGLRDAAQAGGGSWGTGTATSMPGGFLGHPEQGCGHGALAFTSRGTQMCPRRQAAASVPLLAIPRFGSVSLGVRGELQGPARGNHSSSFLPRAVFLLCWWRFCPGAGGGILLSVWFSLSAPGKAVCALCQLPSCAGTGGIRTSQTDANPPLQHREERGCLSPAFSSGFSFWITLTSCLERASGRTCYPGRAWAVSTELVQGQAGFATEL